MHKKCNKLQSGADSFSLRGRRRSVTLRKLMKATRRWLDRQRLAAGSIEAATTSARDVSPYGGGLIHTTVAPPRREHCNISWAILLMCLLAASGDNNHASICCSGAGVSVGGGGPSWRRCVFVSANFCVNDLDGWKDSALQHPTYVGIIHFRSSPVLRKSGRLSNKKCEAPKRPKE